VVDGDEGEIDEKGVNTMYFPRRWWSGKKLGRMSEFGGRERELIVGTRKNARHDTTRNYGGGRNKRPSDGHGNERKARQFYDRKGKELLLFEGRREGGGQESELACLSPGWARANKWWPEAKEIKMRLPH
jgi:hypothetical protein